MFNSLLRKTKFWIPIVCQWKSYELFTFYFHLRRTLDKEIEEDYILLALEEGFDVADFDSRSYSSFLNKKTNFEQKGKA